ncbi:proto-oncogene c-Fos-like [Mizuhopecten yessoensis]|nr:proto-oncogene c-Fos-like [Mizuhopecten yessoensis]
MFLDSMDLLDSCNDFLDPCDLEVINVNSITDEKLRSATLESLETGKITPLLKEELKCRILTRCLEEGKELSPERAIKIQPRKDKLKPDEMMKLEKRREQNRRAARKFRMKKHKTTKTLQQESDVLESKNNDLQDDIQTLLKQKFHLQNLLSEHEGRCRLTPVSERLSPVSERHTPISEQDLSPMDDYRICPIALPPQNFNMELP